MTKSRPRRQGDDDDGISVADEYAGLVRRASFTGPGQRRPRRCLLEYDPDTETIVIRSPDSPTAFLASRMADIEQASCSAARTRILLTVGAGTYTLLLGGWGFPPEMSAWEAHRVSLLALVDRRRKATMPPTLYVQFLRLFREYGLCQ